MIDFLLAALLLAAAYYAGTWMGGRESRRRHVPGPFTLSRPVTSRESRRVPGSFPLSLPVTSRDRWEVVSIEKLQGRDRIVTFTDERKFVGDWLVWHHMDGKRCELELEDLITDRVEEFQMKSKLAKAAAP